MCNLFLLSPKHPQSAAKKKKTRQHVQSHLRTEMTSSPTIIKTAGMKAVNRFHRCSTSWLWSSKSVCLDMFATKAFLHTTAHFVVVLLPICPWAARVRFSPWKWLHSNVQRALKETPIEGCKRGWWSEFVAMMLMIIARGDDEGNYRLRWRLSAVQSVPSVELGKADLTPVFNNKSDEMI